MEADHLTAKNMSDELNEEQEPLNPVDEQTQESAVDPDVELDIEALKQKAAKADEYKKYADRVTAENKTLKKSSTTNQSSTVTREDYERLDLKTDGYKSDEIDFIMQNGGRSALENPIVMAGIESVRKSKKSIEATPSGTGKSYTYQKYGEKDLRKMSAEELEKIVPQD